jgi:hypothetical protein
MWHKLYSPILQVWCYVLPIAERIGIVIGADLPLRRNVWWRCCSWRVLLCWCWWKSGRIEWRSCLFDSYLISMVDYGVILMIANGWLARTLLWWWGSGVCVCWLLMQMLFNLVLMLAACFLRWYLACYLYDGTLLHYLLVASLVRMVACYLLLATCYLLLATCYLLLAKKKEGNRRLK